MAFSLLTNTIAQVATGGSTSAIDTTGCSLLVVMVAETTAPTTTLTDSKGNTWVELASVIRLIGNDCRMFYCINPSNGAGHTFTLSGGTNCTLAVLGFSSQFTPVFDQETGNDAGASTIQPGAIAPTLPDSVLITMEADSSPGTRSIDSGFIKVDDVGAGSSSSGMATAYKVVASIASENPTWTGSGSINRTTKMASFMDVFTGEYPITNTFGLSDESSLVTLFENVADSMALSQESSHNFVYVVIAESLALNSFVGINIEEFLIQYLGFTTREVFNLSDSVFSWDGESEDRRGDFANDVYEFTTNNAFSFGEDVSQIFLADNAFSFTSTVVGAFLRQCGDEFSFEEVVDPAPSDFGRDSAQSCIKQHVSFKIEGGCAEKEYSPFVGSSEDDGYEEIELDAPELIEAGKIVFTYPATSPTITLELKSPAFGNTDAIQFSLIDRTTRGGDRILFSDPDWPTAEILDFTIENAKRQQMLDFVDFVNASLGKEIGLLDWEGRSWRGVIIAPQSPITETVGGYTIVVRFQGAIE
jgi:hypothetical protein